MGSTHRGYLLRIADAEVVVSWGVPGLSAQRVPEGAAGIELGGPGVLHTGGILAGQPKLK